MYLKRAITVNWGNLPPQALEFGPVNLFSGGNGSGKTTAADALQTLMTAARDNLFTFNPGQDETTQRGRGGKQVRTLASYILGCDDGAFARPWDCDGYIAGVFHPTKGETAEPFTAVIGVRAHLDRAGASAQARQDELLLMIVPGEMLLKSHFVRSYPDGDHVVPVTELPNLLRQEFGKKAVETYERKGAYLARLYGALRGKRDAVSQREGSNAARTFARFMAYKPVDSIDQFVAGEVLEARELGDTIRRIRDLLRTVHGMEAEARQLRDSVELLAQARNRADDYLESWLQHQAVAYGAAAQQQQRNQKLLVSEQDQQLQLRQQQKALASERAETHKRLQQVHRELVALEARIQGVPALRTKAELEDKHQQITAQLHAGARPLLEQDQQRNTNLSALQNIRDLLNRHSLALALPELAGRGWRDGTKALLGRADHSLPDLNQLLARDWIDLSPLEAGLDESRSEQPLHNQLAAILHGSEDEQADSDRLSLAQRLDRLVAEREREMRAAEQEQQRIEQQISTLRAHRVSYPRDVSDALAAIRQQCPQADPRVLCDHVDVSDPQWQMAIEGYLGGARFGILVEPDYEAEAIRIVRRLAGSRRNRARVIQGEQARRDAERQSLAEDSIFHVLRFSHRIAEHYLKASYGSVQRVPDADTLRLTRRGITADGLASGNYALFRCDMDDSELVFGEAARERNLRAQQQALEQVQTHYQKATDAYQAVKQLQQQVGRFRPLQWVETVGNLLDHQRQLRELERALQSLDLSAHRDLEQEREMAEQRYAALEQEQRDQDSRSGQFEEQLKIAEKRLRDFADRSEALEQARDDAEAALLAGERHWPGLDVQPRIDAMEQRLAASHEDIDFASEERQLSDTLTQQAVALEQTVRSYNAQGQPADQVLLDSAEALHSAPFFGHVRGLQQQLDNLHNRLRNNVLLEKQEQLATLRDTFNTTFVSDLCHEIHQAIRDGERTLKSLNKELEHHRFGADRERFAFDWSWLPEYKEYWDFFREIIDIPNLGDGSSLFDASLSDKASAVRDRLLALLLDGDEQQALRELERISDYRKYRRYDILKHPENKAPIRLSQYGTGSGGQLETPAYIIRAAAITSAFRFSEGDSHLRMVIVDEAFMHMDETRSREVIGYLTQTLGLQLIFIMPTSKAGPFIDLVSNQFVFSKVPSPQPVGELNTRVLVDRQQLNQERVAELWAQHRRVIRQQGALDFMEEV
ncbi:ATP-binding protein [Parahaliea mediterranea]|uniref:ATP-binding protein n=1 Tax=Parahaliea mediterranea TaxID=651086 RepID=UPI000E2FA968|nr:SbcC/MukB-like Walker B domain-containing protein [Parahaliea mediterranea]